jgi:Flp pilus assembly protein TadD
MCTLLSLTHMLLTSLGAAVSCAGSHAYHAYLDPLPPEVAASVRSAIVPVDVRDSRDSTRQHHGLLLADGTCVTTYSAVAGMMDARVHLPLGAKEVASTAVGHMDANCALLRFDRDVPKPAGVTLASRPPHADELAYLAEIRGVGEDVEVRFVRVRVVSESSETAHPLMFRVVPDEVADGVRVRGALPVVDVTGAVLGVVIASVMSVHFRDDVVPQVSHECVRGDLIGSLTRAPGLPLGRLIPQDSVVYKAFSARVATSTTLAKAGRFDEAVETMQRAVALCPGSWRAQAHLGWTALQAGQYDAARDAFDAARILTPTDVDSVRGKAMALLGLTDVAGARTVLEEAIVGAMDEEQLWSVLGEVRDRMGDTNGAIEAFEQVLRLAPGDLRAAHRIQELKGRE